MKRPDRYSCTAVEDARQMAMTPIARTKRPATNFPLLPILSPWKILTYDAVQPQDVGNDQGQSLMDDIVEKEC